MREEHIHILLVEDNVPDADLVHELLEGAMRGRFTLEHVSQLAEALERLDGGRFDVVLLDLSLPDSQGLGTFERMHDRFPSVPIVLLTGSGDEALALQAVQEGAQDYMSKREVEGNLLAHSLRYAIERKRSEEALRKERDLVARLMDTSPVSITVVDRQGAIIFANARAEEVLGISVDEITGRVYNAPEWRITDFDGEPFPEEELPFRRVMETKRPVYDVRHAIEWPDGRRRLLSINGAPIFEEASGRGRVEKVVFAIEDVTEQVRAQRERIAQLKHEIRALSQIAAQPDTPISARSFGAAPLQESVPDLFEQLIDGYSELLDMTLEDRMYKVEHNTTDAIRDLAERLGALRAGPRDVMSVHITALREKSGGANVLKSAAYAEEGRLIALELMGHLVSYYRNRCVVFGPRNSADRIERRG